MLGTFEKPKKWITISHGNIELSEKGSKRVFSFVEGRLLSIYTGKRNYNGEEVTKWFIDMEDAEGESYTLSFPYNSGTFKSIILALASFEELSPSTTIRIRPYPRGEYTAVAVYADGRKLDWVTKELPPMEEVVLNGTRYRDGAKRMAFIRSLASGVLARIKGGRGNTETRK